MGDIEVSNDAMYGAQTQRGLNNFSISDLRLPNNFVMALAHIKKAAAQTNSDLELLSGKFSEAITKSVDEILECKHSNQFTLDLFQTGSGTS